MLVYAHVAGMPEHERASDWLDRTLNDSPRVGLPWPSLLAFIRLVVNPRIFERPESLLDAWRQVESWLGVDSVWIPLPTRHHREILGELLREIGGKPELVPDAHLAALAIEHGATLCSSDGDFARFTRLRWENPLRG